MTYELLIAHGDKVMFPAVTGEITVEWERTGQPGKMKFSAMADEKLDIDEGDSVRLSVDGKPFFYGFIFNRAFSGENNACDITVYDQLYYLKNKDTYVYTNKTASAVLRMIADDFHLNLGSVDDTSYVIPSRTEDNSSLFDVMQNALDETVKHTGEIFVLYDDIGKLCLRSLAGMKSVVTICADTAGDYSYSVGISDKTYDRVKLVYENSKSGVREVYISQDSSNINRWGVLQYFEKVNSSANLKSAADAMLGLYNTKTRSLSVKNVLGDTSVRAGTLLPVVLDTGDMKLSNYLLCEQVKHTFGDNSHLMDIKLKGGKINA